METFVDDLSYWMTLLNVTFQRHVMLSRDTKLDAIYDSVQGDDDDDDDEEEEEEEKKGEEEENDDG
jgi:hypothetical protein